MTEEHRFKLGDKVYFDEYPGTIVGDAFEEPGLYGTITKYHVHWGGGKISIAWQSDLQSEAEYQEDCEKYG